MAVHHFSVSLTTTASTLFALVGTTTASRIGVAKQIFLQADSANVAIIRVGGAAQTLSSTVYGLVIPIPITSIPAAPLPIESTSGMLSLADIQVMGANTTDKVRIFMVCN